ncbi:hypothetical protein QN277_024476 [Acacia crassicarpa]|uniref:RING-type E3 ubiquitin transferase n=1 Tax=Acacia crassicarpa TaxID=499986 RepID=A0AAE1JEW0_9FABA|nr:hypothetical protein QN277_024476 [Acacia crassicarpa]
MTSSYISISEDLMEDRFDISFTVIQHGISPTTGLLQMTHFEVFQSPITMPCEELIRDVPTFLYRNVRGYLSENDVGLLASEIIYYHQEVIRRTTIRTTEHRLIPLIVDLHVATFDHGLVHSFFNLQTTAIYGDNEYIYMIDVGDDDQEPIEFSHVVDSSIQQSFDYDNRHIINTTDDPESVEINQLIEESMQHLFIVPTTQEAISLLKKMKISDDKVKEGQCSICLEDFDDRGDGDDVLGLPCDHFFHHNCIVQWLNMGHTCPLCRFELPIE